MQGTFKGFYKYDKETLKKAVGFGRTYFTIVISEVNGSTFTGTVEDDIHTGGMPGVGIIKGEIEGGHISFTKQMPKAMYLAKEFDGTHKRKEIDRRHPPIYYSGTEVEKGKFAGTWKIKPQILLYMLMLLLGMKTTGTWEMTKYE